MQISRHWRMNSQRYRLEGVRYQNGEISLQGRPASQDADEQRKHAGKSETAPQLRTPVLATAR